MNNLDSELLEKNDLLIIDDDYFKNLFISFCYRCEKEKINILISQIEFIEIIRTIYEVLKFKINDEFCDNIIKIYLRLIIVDAKEGNTIDINWFIFHLYYLSNNFITTINKEDYIKYIPFIQDTLIRKFDVKENSFKKLTRSLYTRFMANI